MRAWITVWAIAACGGASPTPAPLPTNHPVAPPPPTTSDAVLAWPVAPFTATQVTEVKGCDTDKLGETRYPKTLGIDGLAGAYAVKGACDQATLAAACAARMKEEGAPSPTCLAAYRATLQANPAFAFANGLAGGYFGKVASVAPPPVAQRKLTRVAITYAWSGLGTGVKWTVAAHDLATTPAIDITGGKPVAWSPDVATAVTRLGSSLHSFLPIGKPLEAIDCTDNYPDWTATLGFDDGTQLELFTKGSNLLGLGGPWQTTLGGVTYLQLGPDFTLAIAKLVKALGLAIGEPQGEFCRGFDLQAAVFQ
jgi:hypothetical protein